MNNERRPPMGPRNVRRDDRFGERRDDRFGGRGDDRLGDRHDARRDDRDPRRGGPPRRPGQHGPSGPGAGERRFGGGARRGPGGMSGGQHRQGGRGGPRRPGGGRPGAHRPGGPRRREHVEVENDDLLSGPIEANYLRELVSARTPIEVKLRNGQTHSGTIEYWDQRFIRLSPPSGANLFIFKHDIKYLLEK